MGLFCALGRAVIVGLDLLTTLGSLFSTEDDDEWTPDDPLTSVEPTAAFEMMNTLINRELQLVEEEMATAEASVERAHKRAQEKRDSGKRWG